MSKAQELADKLEKIPGLTVEEGITTDAAARELRRLDRVNADVEHLRKALNDAAESLKTIHLLGGRSHFGDGIPTHLETVNEIRDYARNRSSVAFAALSSSGGNES